jgi:hypothetical protein
MGLLSSFDGAGPSLAAELQRQLAQRQVAAPAAAAAAAAGAMPGPLSLPQRDLLGRRIASNSNSSIASSAATAQAAGAAAGGGWMSGSPATSAELAAVLPLSARGSMHYKTL